LIVEGAAVQCFTESDGAKKFGAPKIDVVGPAWIEDYALGVTLPVADAKIVAEWIGHGIRICGDPAVERGVY
jgi:hypothetical protein